MGPLASVILQLALLPGAAIRDGLKPEGLVLDAGAILTLRGADLKFDVVWYSLMKVQEYECTTSISEWFQGV